MDLRDSSFGVIGADLGASTVSLADVDRARHLAALTEAPELADLYRRLAAALLALDLALTPAERAAIEQLVRPASSNA